MQPNRVVLPTLIATIVLLSACAPRLPANPPRTMATIMPSTASTDLPLVTETAVDTRTPAARDDLIVQDCLDILPAEPANFKTKGIVPLQDYATLRTFFLNLETGDKAKIPPVEKRIDAFAVSPDGKALVYKIYAKSPGISLTLTDALNQHGQVILVKQDDFGLYGWLNNHQLLLLNGGVFVGFNPRTLQETTGYSIDDFPGYDSLNPHNRWVVRMDPQMSMAIYKNDNGNTSLFDLGNKRLVAEMIDAFQRPPVAQWTVDGSEAAIIGTTVVGQHPAEAGDNIFGVSRDGQITQLTHLAEHYGAGFNIHSMSWSPDARHIAFWMRHPGVKLNDWVLGVLDTSTKQVTDYCILSDPYLHTSTGPSLGLPAPIWSLDGRQIMVEHRTDDSKYVVLLDITQNIAFQIAPNMSPLGWMLPAQ